MSNEQTEKLRELTREHAYLVWQLAKAGAPQEGEHKVLARALLEHSEYHDVWDRLLEYGENDIEIDGVNPLLHINIHGAIENQLANRDPASVAHAYRRLMRQGFSRHETIHQLGTVLTQEIWEIMSSNEPFDAERYDRGMRQIGRVRPRPAKQKRRKKRR